MTAWTIVSFPKCEPLLRNHPDITSERSLEVKFPTIWTDEKPRWEESEKRREEKSQKQKVRRKSQEKEGAGARKVDQSQNTVCSQGSTGRLAKAADAEPFGQMRHEKVHNPAVRSRFQSYRPKSISCSERLCKSTCRKSARRCGTLRHAEVHMYQTHQLRSTFGS